MRYYVEAYDREGNQILGNGDGQTTWVGQNYKKTGWYRGLATFKSLNNRVGSYKIIRKTVRYEEIEVVYPNVSK